MLANQLVAPPNKTKHALQVDWLPIKPISSLSQGRILILFHKTKLKNYKVYNL